MHSIHLRYWKREDKLTLKKLQKNPGTGTYSDFRKLGRLALTVISRHPGGVHMVSGPITSGLTAGRVCTRDENLKVFGAMIELLADRKALDMFSQMPFEHIMVNLYLQWRARHPKAVYCFPLLNGFYRPIFQSGFVTALHCMHGYETSIGACWEEAECELLGIQTPKIPKKWSQEIYDKILG